HHYLHPFPTRALPISCFYDLGRFGEAEADYLQAAALDASLATLSLVNAAYAALDGGSPRRAREIAGRARAAMKPSEADLVADLEDRKSTRLNSSHRTS